MGSQGSQAVGHSSAEPKEDFSCDYVIVGAGSAGAALASRLSTSSDEQVLLLEAGGKMSSVWLHIPLGLGLILDNPNFVWPWRTEEEFGARRLLWHHGCVLGGSSSINAMLYVRGQPQRYDMWCDAGCPGWAFADLLPYFKRMEDVAFGDPEYRGRGGPVPVTMVDPEDEVSQSFLESCTSLQIPRNEDYNGATTDGCAPLQLNTRNGVRWGTAKAYLKPLRNRQNLRLELGATVTRVFLEGKRATGVEFIRNGHRARVRARREVILCGGAMHSPQLLELSGIGRAEVLRQHGVEVVHELPGIGENLRDHLHSRTGFETDQSVTVNDLFTRPVFAAREVLRYLLFRKGLFATPSFRAHAFVRSPKAAFADVRIQCALYSSESRHVDHGLDKFSGFHLGSYFLFPESRGSIHISSADPHAMPAMRANYLSDSGDIEAALWAFRMTRKIAAAAPLSQHIVREVRPGTECESDDEILDFIKANGETSWHQIGSCRMGKGRDCVVDPRLRVHGLSGLRVADASVMPFHTSSNTNVPSIMIGERAADLIREDKE